MMRSLEIPSPRLFGAILLAFVAAAIAAVATIGTGAATGANTVAPGFKADGLNAAVSQIELLRDNVASDLSVTETEVDNSPLDPSGDLVDTKHVIRPAVAAGARSKLGEGLIVAPTRNGEGLCTIGTGRMACADADDITARGGVFGVSWRGDGVTALTGLALDSVSSVTVTYGGGGSEVVPVQGNVVNAALPKRPASISWTGPAGKQTANIAQDPAGTK